MYKVEKYLHRCLNSVKNQTFQDWQAICVDDGSPDNSGKIAEEYAKQDKRFIVVHKENGGLSDARNYGMKYAKAKYIMYLDSDDFIHPQTMEIAYSLAEKNKSDIVSFTYDRFYRPQLMVRHILHLNTDGVIPYCMNKKYDLNKIKTKTTDDVFEYATERTHNKFNPNRRWLIKHCQVWKNMYRKKLIEDTPFIKGILFEDFPWWSAIMLKNPRITIAPLPLYFYVPNFGGIVLSEKQLCIMQSLCAGIKTAYRLYRDNATDYQMQKWSEHFLWWFINWAFRKIKYLSDAKDLKIARREFKEIIDMGVMDTVPNQWCDLANKIYMFVGSKA